MKIAIVVWDLSISGGTQRQALELANYLVNKGHKVKIYTAFLDTERCYPGLIKKIDVHGLYYNSPPKKSFLRRFFFPVDPILFRGVYEKILSLMEKDFDIINPHDQIAYRIGCIYKKKYKKPVVWMMNDLPFSVKKLHANSGDIRSILKILLYPFRGRPIGKFLDKKCITCMDRVVVLDHRNKRLLLDNLGLEPTVIRSGLNIEKFQYRKRDSNSQKDEFKILATGIFFPHRRFEDLIKAMKLLRKEGYNVHLTHIGSDRYGNAYAQKIYRLVSKLNLSKYVTFLGAVPEEELIENYAGADVFVFPNYPQTWGLAVFEAMACGVPVIVSTGCGAAEVLIDGENALLVQPKKPDKIAEAVKILINDGKLRAKLSHNGRKFVEKNISWDIYGKNMEGLFKELIDSKRRHY